MDYADYPDSTSNQTVIYATADSITTDSPMFDLVFEALSVSCYWSLFLVTGGVALSHVLAGRARGLQRWPVYLMTLLYVFLNCISESIALGYTVAATKRNSTYLAYIFFWHASNATFLMVLLALSSGYCITRPDLRGQELKVLLIPAIIFIAGVASDFTFVYVQSTQPLSAAGDRYDIVSMTPFESIVWVVGSLANIMCFILAWIVIFDSTQLEIKALDDAQAALQRGEAEDGEANGSSPGHEQQAARPGVGGQHGPGTDGRRPLGTTSQRVGLLHGMEGSNGRQQQGDRSGGGAGEDPDVEEGAHKETFADTLQYTIRKRLLTRFYICVCAYLLAAILVILLPAFFNAELQNTIVVLEFLVKWGFTILLAWFFRPTKDSPYLQIGFNDNDSATELDTELVVTDYHTPAAGAQAVSNQLNTGVMSNARGQLNQSAHAEGGHAPQLPVSTQPGAAAATQPGTERRWKGGYAPAPRESANGATFTLDDDE